MKFLLSILIIPASVYAYASIDRTPTVRDGKRTFPETTSLPGTAKAPGIAILPGKRVSSGGDSLLPVRNSYASNEETAPDWVEAETTDAERDYSRTGNSRRTLVRLLKIIKRSRTTGRGGYRLFNDLADLSARCKLYPLAMKCYYKALEYKYRNRISFYEPPAYTESGLFPPGAGDGDFLLDSASTVRLLNMDTASALPDPPYTLKSEPVKAHEIAASFEDGKTASSYALIVHVKQPVPGKRRAFTHINNVGHMFITLIKYNTDNSFTSRSFGFYPRKKNIFSATPLHVKAPPVFKDDTLHDWDETAGKFISVRRFTKILELLQQYDRMVYNLNQNNCTDFGLHAAELGGISIMETRGSWPLGKGNNPANAGQSMLEGKVRNTDPDHSEPLFVSNNLPGHTNQ